MKTLIVDTREKKNQHITSYFDTHNIPYIVRKLDYGDYQDHERTGTVIERKQSILELAGNCTRGRARFHNELERAKAAGSHMVILVEQNRYKDRGHWVYIHDISDLMLWSNPHTTIRGEKVFRVLSGWVAKYGIEVQFCNRHTAGRRICEAIYYERRKS